MSCINEPFLRTQCCECVGSLKHYGERRQLFDISFFRSPIEKRCSLRFSCFHGDIQEAFAAAVASLGALVKEIQPRSCASFSVLFFFVLLFEHLLLVRNASMLQALLVGLLAACGRPWRGSALESLSWLCKKTCACVRYIPNKESAPAYYLMLRSPLLMCFLGEAPSIPIDTSFLFLLLFLEKSRAIAWPNNYYVSFCIEAFWC